MWREKIKRQLNNLYEELDYILEESYNEDAGYESIVEIRSIHRYSPGHFDPELQCDRCNRFYENKGRHYFSELNFSFKSDFGETYIFIFRICASCVKDAISEFFDVLFEEF